jgi:hypothetical protein
MQVSELHYEPILSARAVVVEQGDGMTRIVIPMPGLYAPVPRWVGDLDVLAFVVAPIWWVAALLVRTFLRLPKPPRAVFEISENRFKMTLQDTVSGDTCAFDWPRSSVVEARANRYDAGLWMNVTGHVKETYLTDLPRETIQRLDVALNEALARGMAISGI